MLLTLTLIPVLATHLFNEGSKTWENPLLAWVYASMRSCCVGRWAGRIIVATAALIVAGAFLLASFLGTEFLPQLDEGVIWIRANLPPGISLAKSAEMAHDMRAILKESSEVKLVSSQTGRNDSGTDPFGPNRNELLITLTPYSTWKPGKKKSNLIEEFSQKLRSQIPGTLNLRNPLSTP
jgi:cobalt-zinc-cadmium resistance protein CzcA